MSRWVEVALAVFVLIFLTPMMIMIWGLVLVVDGRPVLFVSDRIGRGGRRFKLYKYRTMVVAARVGVAGGHIRGDVTRLGRILRRTRLDELPQIVNVLRGDLAFVGPRPPAPEHVLADPEAYRHLMAVRPGITGLATLAFHRHEEQMLSEVTSQTEAEALYLRRCVRRKARIDRLYRGKRSALFDLWLMALTAQKVLGNCPTGRLPRLRSRRGGFPQGGRRPAVGSAKIESPLALKTLG